MVRRIVCCAVVIVALEVLLGGRISAMTDVPLDGFIDKARVDWVIQNTKPGDRLVINSIGGDLYHATRLSDHVRNNKIYTHVNSTGVAHSAAALVYSAGVKRTAGANAQFMIHPGVDAATGQRRDDATAYFLNRYVGFGVKGGPELLKVLTGDWVMDYDAARKTNLISEDMPPWLPQIGPLD